METGQERKTHKKHRSPNHPGLSLTAALEKARTVYDQEKRTATSPEVILKHLGYSPTSGSGKRILSALKGYGLLEERAGAYRVSDLALRLLHLPEGHPERLPALQEAALAPEIHRELLAKYKDGLPSNESLKAELITHRGFNPVSVEEFVKNFRQTLALAQITPGEVTNLQAVSDEAERMAEDTHIIDMTSAASAAPRVRFYRWPISQPRNITAELRIYGQDLRREDVQRIKKQLELLEETFEEPSSD